MANLFTPSLEGDGIDFSFFHCLWNKNRNEGQNDRLGRGSKSERGEDLALRLPDTVVFQLGQPLRWYFTSEREKQPLILRKRKQNLSAAKIEQEFLRKARLGRKSLDQNDLVAYFIASDRKSINPESKENDEVDDFKGCGIEYFNEEGFRKINICCCFEKIKYTMKFTNAIYDASTYFRVLLAQAQRK